MYVEHDSRIGPLALLYVKTKGGQSFREGHIVVSVPCERLASTNYNFYI